MTNCGVNEYRNRSRMRGVINNNETSFSGKAFTISSIRRVYTRNLENHR